MVATRRAPSIVPNDEHTAEPPDGSMKISREMRKLVIDANPSLGGHTSLKRKRTGFPEPHILPPTPPHSSWDKSTQGSPNTDSQPRKKFRKSVTFTDDVVLKDEEHTATMRSHFADYLDDVVKQETDADNQQYWFLPEDAAPSESGTPPKSPPVILQQPLAHVGLQISSQAPSPENSPGAQSKNRKSPSTENNSDTHGAIHLTEPTPTTASRPARMSRELRRLQIDANSSLSYVDTITESKSPQDAINGSQTKRASQDRALSEQEEDNGDYMAIDGEEEREDSEVLDHKEQKMSREMRKLLIDANPALGGATQVPVKERRRRTLSEPQLYARELARRKKLPKVVKPFPDPCPRDLADWILLLFADAAGETETVRILEGKAEHAVARHIRHETQDEKEERIKRELAVIDNWNVVPTEEVDDYIRRSREEYERQEEVEFQKAELERLAREEKEGGDHATLDPEEIEKTAARGIDDLDAEDGSADNKDEVIIDTGSAVRPDQHLSDSKADGKDADVLHDHDTEVTPSTRRRWKGKGRAS